LCSVYLNSLPNVLFDKLLTAIFFDDAIAASVEDLLADVASGFAANLDDMVSLVFCREY
jgi:hypothetical protein